MPEWVKWSKGICGWMMWALFLVLFVITPCDDSLHVRVGAISRRALLPSALGPAGLNGDQHGVRNALASWLLGGILRLRVLFH